MRRRTLGRELALKILYQIDVIKEDPVRIMQDFFSQQEAVGPDVEEFAKKLVAGTQEHLQEIDTKIAAFATNWELSRMAIIDRNILRLGSFELMFAEDIPSKVSINEAIELAKKFGGTDSGKFVNGILDKINKTDLKKN